jgi:hypothetical protein
MPQEEVRGSQQIAGSRRLTIGNRSGTSSSKGEARLKKEKSNFGDSHRRALKKRAETACGVGYSMRTELLRHIYEQAAQSTVGLGGCLGTVDCSIKERFVQLWWLSFCAARFRSSLRRRLLAGYAKCDDASTLAALSRYHHVVISLPAATIALQTICNCPLKICAWLTTWISHEHSPPSFHLGRTN